MDTISGWFVTPGGIKAIMRKHISGVVISVALSVGIAAIASTTVFDGDVRVGVRW
jgi:hypothetical protein